LNIFLAISYVLKSVFLGQIEQIREKNEVDVASDIDKTNDLIMKFSTNTLRFLMVLIIVLFSVDKSSAQSVCEECTISNPAVDQNSILTINADEVVCFTESRTIGGLDIKGGTICISEGATLTVNNNVNSYNGSTLELEIYGTLQFNQVTTLNSTVIINIYNSGELRSGTSGSNDFSFNGSGISYINNDGKLNIGTLTFSNSSGEYIFDNYGVIDISSNINIGAKLTKFKNNFEGTMSIGASFNMNEGTEFYNCGEITTATGFNMGGGNVVNTNSFTVNGNVNYGNGTSRFDNFGTLNINNGDIQMANNTYFYNEGVAIFSGGSFANDGHILGPEEGSGKLGYIYFDKAVTMNNGSIGPNLNFKNTNGTSSFAVMFNDRPNINIEDGVSWDCESSGTCAAEKQIVLDLCPDFDGNFPDPEVPLNTTNAVDDFYETGKNTSISGNVLDNDFDLEDDTQTVSTTGTFTTDKGGSVAINANGTFTYTPPAGGFSDFDSFKYTVCDDGAPKACDEADVVIAVGICSEAVEGEPFKWSNTTPNGAVESGNTLSKTITQPAANYGFVFDIYELDNSFNMEINGVKLAVHEIEFQSSGTPAPGINIRFADGDKYEANTQDIWQMKGTADRPLIRVMIGPTGKVSMYGSKLSGGKLYPLVLFNGNSFNVVPMYVGDGEDNVITVTQNMVGVTKIEGTGYGANQIDCPNYWYGYDGSNEWADIENWTDNYVPENLQDIEFATEDNNSGAILGLSGKAAGLGVAKEDLHLDDAGRIIRDLINKSDKNLVVTLDNLLIVDGKVREDNTGGVVVQADPNDVKAMGSLKFNNPGNNLNVAATVQFHNNACECADCGFYRKQWQYFGVPVKSATFPYMDVDGEETINMYVEPHNGDKWRPVSGELNAFKGYQINNNLDAAPQDVYNFAGTLFVGDATVALTKTENVNYSGTNLVSNSYTAAIPISAEAMVFPAEAEQTVYLFNTGTRDQWRKLNGTNIPGYKSGQYLSVPLNLGGTSNFPDRIPSTHAFMILTEGEGNLNINYSELTKNTKVNRGDGSQIVTRSVDSNSNTSVSEAPNAKQQLPSLVMDVIGEQSADRVWIFAKEGASHGFDNGWDGRKMAESGIAQLYVTGSDESQLQVATVPTMENVLLGFEADADGKYTLEFSLSEQLNTVDIHLQDLVTGMSQRLSDGGSYQFEAKKGDTAARFRLSQSGEFKAPDDEALIDIEPAGDGKVMIRNRGGSACTAFISNDKGAVLQRVEVSAGGEKVLENMSAGVYVIRLQNATVNDARRVVVN